MTDKPDSPDSDAAGAEVLAPEAADSSGKRSIEQQFRAMITSVQRGPAPNPIATHITPDVFGALVVGFVGGFGYGKSRS